ncbi:MAG: ATP-dependent Clp protease ATP-binding subunit [Myxococcota bacterium]|jgi:ATP-dependent Clp protease ATP-binding subunit ClpC
MLTTQYDATCAQIISEAEDIARKTEQRLSSVHYLLALFVVPNDAGSFLLSKKINEDKILGVVEAGHHESPEVIEQIKTRAEEYARQLRSRSVNSMHLLLAMCRSFDSIANHLLVSSGVKVDQIRNNLFTIVTGGLKPGFIGNRPVSPPPVQVAPHQPRPVEFPREMLPPTVITEERINARIQAHAAVQAAAQSADGPVAPVVQPMELGDEEFPLLCKLGRNITSLAMQGKLDSLIGRERELGEIIDILGKRRTNNPILVGEPGVGKTALVEGLALLMAQRPEIVPSLAGKVLVELDMGRVMAGTQLRGALAERLNGVKDEVRKAEGRVIVFFDEIHQLVGGEGAEDAANGLKSALARGEFPCVGATTSDEYTKFIESDPAFKRRFQMVLVPEPDFNETVKILQGIVADYQKHHCVTYTPDALKAAASLSSRYIGDRFLPDKAISILDLAGSRARREGREAVTEIEIARVVSGLARIPVEKLLMTDRDRFLKMEDLLSGKIIGHRNALASIAAVIRRNYAGFGARRPIGSFIFLGPTRVGKTQTVKALAEFLFQDREAMVRLDMSEYSEAHAVAKLIGAPPGYVGFDAGGQLTEAVRKKPFTVVLLDEVEKAHREVMQMFLQVFDDGRLTDGRGRTIDFSNTVIIMTSNLGNQEFRERHSAPIGFGGSQQTAAPDDAATARVLEAAKAHFPLELWNRIDERIVFHPLERPQIVEVAKLLLAESSARLKTEKGISFAAEQGAIDFLIENGGFVPELGARPMRQAVQRLVEARIAEMILRGEISGGDTVTVVRGTSGLAFNKS